MTTELYIRELKTEMEWELVVSYCRTKMEHVCVLVNVHKM